MCGSNQRQADTIEITPAMIEAGAQLNEDWRTVLVTPDMAEIGASVLRETQIGEDMVDVAKSVFYIMQSVARSQATNASASSTSFE